MARQPGEKKALLALLEQAQLVYLMTRFPKKQVLGNPADAERLDTGMTKMRAAAKELGPSLRAKQSGVQWDELLATSDSPDLAWRRAKRVGPQCYASCGNCWTASRSWRSFSIRQRRRHRRSSP